MQRPTIEITEEIFCYAQEMIAKTRVYRTQASQHDTMTGNLGELAFAEWYFGDWRKNTLGASKGRPDFGDIEIKTSAYPFRESLNLKVRSDYADRRTPSHYVQQIINIPARGAPPAVGQKVVICGFCVGSDLKQIGQLKPEITNTSSAAGYSCWNVSLSKLSPMSEFPLPSPPETGD